MATLDVTEFQVLGQDRNYRWSLAAQCPPPVKQQLTSSGVTAQSAAFQDSTRFIRVHNDGASAVRVEVGGLNPVASATSFRMAINTTEYFGVFPGDKLAVITTT